MKRKRKENERVKKFKRQKILDVKAESFYGNEVDLRNAYRQIELQKPKVTTKHYNILHVF